MEELSLTCTTKTPFCHPIGDIYLQVDGVSMSSPLGPLLANFYMAHIENTVLDDLNPDTKPTVYCRYVDDIFVVVSNLGQIYHLKTKFENSSGLNFTHEMEKKKSLAFLDVNLLRTDWYENGSPHQNNKWGRMFELS